MINKAAEFLNAAIHIRRDFKELKVELVRMMDQLEAKERRIKEIELRQSKLEGLVEGFMKAVEKTDVKTD